ncbi:hypothetical protein J40TS1_21190 [Paenibacillus montaniterrae]|uniref:Uncharacterized protein n=1 Tax=Paenibacillus montaniterrae TaxID=429341 RepID=A0A920CU00_9BACL|nr:hypothetical protein J40TS1_21190 [Paenibacillus montaniterrae]
MPSGLMSKEQRLKQLQLSSKHLALRVQKRQQQIRKLKQQAVLLLELELLQELPEQKAK